MGAFAKSETSPFTRFSTFDLRENAVIRQAIAKRKLADLNSLVAQNALAAIKSNLTSKAEPADRNLISIKYFGPNRADGDTVVRAIIDLPAILRFAAVFSIDTAFDAEGRPSASAMCWAIARPRCMTLRPSSVRSMVLWFFLQRKKIGWPLAFWDTWNAEPLKH